MKLTDKHENKTDMGRLGTGNIKKKQELSSILLKNPYQKMSVRIRF
jgi:hypothetical protein